MLRITAPGGVTDVRVGGLRFVDGVATAERLTPPERLYLATRGYRIEATVEPPAVTPDDDGD